jgi:CDP-diacylglycerol---serine O-phosphatidyltransferase
LEQIKKAIPNLFTLGNLSCGVIGIVLSFNGDITTACYLIWLAAGFDFLDGFLARILKAQSEIGKQLDSLADLITFGLLPAMLYYHMLVGKVASPLEYVGVLIACFSALRLAKFNIDENQTTTFTGLTTTANGIYTSTLPLILLTDNFLTPIFDNTWVLVASAVIFSLLMVAPVTLLSFKFSNFSLKDNWARFLLIIISIVCIVIWQISAVPIIIVIYLILSLLSLSPNKKTKEKSLS